MTYQETIDYLYKALPMFSRIGAAAYKKDLHNTLLLCEAFGNPHQQFKSIHIAGTNGKGSVSHMAASILQTSGYKTGLYTSPHLKDFRERIKVNGEMCDEDFVINFANLAKPLIEKIQPSFFEITVAMAFSYFARQNVDVAVIETGLGGRLDSTNVIFPELSVITNIGWDHMNILGDTLEKIAYEKAGIIKENIPVVIGEWLPDTRPVFETRATEKNASLHLATDKRYVNDWKFVQHKLAVTVVEKPDDAHKTYLLDLPGIYQVKNLLTVLEMVHQLKLRGFDLSEEQTKRGLSAVKKLTGFHGRWEQINNMPTVILDVAHNAEGIKCIVEQIELSTFNRLHLIIGMVKDKDVSRSLSLLPAFANYYFTKAQIPRAMPETELAEKGTRIGLQGHTYPDVNTALQDAMLHAHEDDMIIIFGSVFLVGEVKI